MRNISPAPAPEPAAEQHPAQVWVRTETRHTPAHAVAAGSPAAAGGVLTRCGWRPGGGVVITRAVAITIQAMPCCRCFAIPPTP